MDRQPPESNNYLYKLNDSSESPSEGWVLKKSEKPQIHFNYSSRITTATTAPNLSPHLSSIDDLYYIRKSQRYLARRSNHLALKRKIQTIDIDIPGLSRLWASRHLMSSHLHSRLYDTTTLNSKAAVARFLSRYKPFLRIYKTPYRKPALYLLNDPGEFSATDKIMKDESWF